MDDADGYGFMGAPRPAGTILGPGASTNKAIVRWTGTAGDAVQDSTVTVEDDGTLAHLTDPAGPQDAATKHYVDDQLASAAGLADLRYRQVSVPLVLSDSADVSGDLPLANLAPAAAAARLLGRGEGGAGDWEPVTLGAGLAITGTTLAATARASGVFNYGFNATVMVAPPNNATIRFNAGAPYTGVTTVWADFDSANSEDLYYGWMRITVGSALMIQDKDNHDQFAEFTVTAAPVDKGTYVELSVTHKAHGGTPLATQAVLVRITTVSATAAPPAVIGCTYDGGGSALTAGAVRYVHVPFAHTITEAVLLADVSGSAVVDVWRDTYTNYPPTVADTITASAKPTLSGALKSIDSTLTGWSKTAAAGTVYGFKLDSAATVTVLQMQLTVTPT